MHENEKKNFDQMYSFELVNNSLLWSAFDYVHVPI